MTTDLEFIMELNEEKITIKTLKKIKERLNTLRNIDYIKSIKDCSELEHMAEYFPGTKMIGINYSKIMNFLDEYENAIYLDIPQASIKEMKMLRLITAYRIFLHEIHHSKQFYNAYETDSADLESEIIRSIYNMDRKKFLKELRTRTRREIMEEKTFKINEELLNYSEINPLERKAEIESFRQVRSILAPIRGMYMNLYDELYLLELAAQINGYDKEEVPFIQTLNTLKENIPNYKVNYPYGCKDKYDLFETTEEITSEQERFELGLNVKDITKQKTDDKMCAIIYR